MNEAKILVDQSGRPLGPRALDKRRLLMDSAKRLLDEKGLRDLKVVDIARQVHASPATFYQYFKDVGEVVLALAARAADEMPTLAQSIHDSWEGDEGMRHARKVVEAFIDHWDEHSSVLRARNLAADEGDPRFERLRARNMYPVISALQVKVEASQASKPESERLDPVAAAAAMAAILERLAAYHEPLTVLGVSRVSLVETSARILFRTVTGRE